MIRSKKETALLQRSEKTDKPRLLLVFRDVPSPGLCAHLPFGHVWLVWGTQGCLEGEFTPLLTPAAPSLLQEQKF